MSNNEYTTFCVRRQMYARASTASIFLVAIAKNAPARLFLLKPAPGHFIILSFMTFRLPVCICRAFPHGSAPRSGYLPEAFSNQNLQN